MGNHCSECKTEASVEAPANVTESFDSSVSDVVVKPFIPIIPHPDGSGPWINVTCDFAKVISERDGDVYPLQEESDEASDKEHLHRVKIQSAVRFEDCPKMLKEHSFCVFDVDEALNNFNFERINFDDGEGEWLKWTSHFGKIIKQKILKSGKEMQQMEPPVVFPEKKVVAEFHTDTPPLDWYQLSLWIPFIKNRHLIMKSNETGQLFANESGKGVIFHANFGDRSLWHSGFKFKKAGERIKTVYAGGEMLDVLVQPVEWDYTRE